MELAAFASGAAAFLHRLRSLKHAPQQQQEQQEQALTVSASGKVLITGGYLVLERPKSGLVVATSSRFHSTLSWRDAGAAAPSSALAIAVHSPQFGVSWSYRLEQDAGGVLRLKPSNPDQSDNVYVEATLLYTMAAVLASRSGQTLGDVVAAADGKGRCLHVLLRADNDFYSQQGHLRKRGLAPTRANLASLPKYLACPVDANGKAQVAKTGMGSSAALITSLVGALVALFNETDLSRPEGKDLAFKVAQICHAVAQGKVGSGFDVCAATWGSHCYTRFSKTVLQPVLSSDAPLSAGVSPSFVAPMVSSSSSSSSSSSTSSSSDTSASPSSSWDHQVVGFQLPPGFELLMGDICGGSETPSMVRKVLAWKKDGDKVTTVGTGSATGLSGELIDSMPPEELWESIDAVNERVREQFELLRRQASSSDAATQQEYAREIARCASLPCEQWRPSNNHDGNATNGALCELRSSFKRARVMLRRMGERAGVPIEPPPQTALCDATESVPGVLVCGVPGAGGYDAVFVIALSKEALARVEDLWLAQGKGGEKDGGQGEVCPLLLRAEGCGSGYGIRRERGQ